METRGCLRLLKKINSDNVIGFDWVVPNFLLWNIYGIDSKLYGGRETFTFVRALRFWLN